VFKKAIGSNDDNRDNIVFDRDGGRFSDGGVGIYRQDNFGFECGI
tara:strand:+ start:224 stop:358 length:135 start_codon:yes stop_codon:yes gene_type:complete